MIINDLDGYYIVFDTKNWNTELDTLVDNNSIYFQRAKGLSIFIRLGAIKDFLDILLFYRKQCFHFIYAYVVKQSLP